MEIIMGMEAISLLRQRGIITNEEIAITVGDLIIAENVVDKSRRVLKDEKIRFLKESNKRLLKG